MGFGSEKQTVGYKYYIGMHMAVCHGPVDAVTQITVGDRVAWSGNVTGTQDVAVSAENLFGGEKREGGVSGTVGFKFGEPTQAQDAYLAAQLGADCPAFRGVLSFVLKKVYIGNNPYLKNWAFKIKRLPAKGWYDAKRDIGGHANPAHIVYECVTNGEWGMGYPTSALDDAKFKAVADTLHAEGFGLSLIFNRQGPIHEFIQQILDHIGGVFRLNQSTGLFEIKLIRDDYAPESLPLLNESNVASLDSYQRAAWGETVNEIVLQYTTADEKDTAITVQDLGNIQIQGGVVSETIRYPGIRDDGIAQRVATRELKARSTPLSRIRLTVNRQGWNLRAGDVFRFSWDKLGLSEAVFRVGQVQGGTLQDGKITIEAAEDIFGLPTNTYAAQQPVGWTSPNNAPAAAPYRLVYEAPYWDMVRAFGEADAQALPADAGYLVAAAVRPSSDAINFDLLTRTGSTSYEEQGTGNFCPTCVLSEDLAPAVSSTITFTGGVDMEDVEVGDYAIIGGTEWVAVTALNVGAGAVVVDRGILDTVPVAHDAGTRIFFPYQLNGFDQTEWLDSETVDAKILPVTGMGTLSEASAPADSLTMSKRQARPYPPGNVRVNGQRWPTAITGPVTIEWSHRDRLQQTAGFIKQDASNIGPESGTFYNLKLYDEADVLRRTITGNVGTSYTWASEVEDSGLGRVNSQVKVELWSARGSVLFADVLAGLNPTAHYRMDDTNTTLLDASGNGYHGTYSGSYTQNLTGLTGEPGKCVRFSGGRAVVATLPAFGSMFTLVALVKPTNLSGHQTIIGRDLTNPMGRAAVYFKTTSAGDAKPVITLTNAAGTILTTTSPTTITAGKTHLLVAVLGATQLKLYVNGNPTVTARGAFSMSGQAPDVAIGNGYFDDVLTDFYQGDLDEVAIFNDYEMPDAVVTALYSAIGATSGASIESMQKHVLQFDRAGYGFNYGKYYGGI